MRERPKSSRRTAYHLVLGAMTFLVVTVILGCGNPAGSGTGTGSPSIAVSEALLTTTSDDGTTVVALSLYSQLGGNYDVPDGTDVIQVYFFVDSEGDAVTGSVDLEPTTEPGSASAMVIENLSQSDARWFVASTGTLDANIPEFESAESGSSMDVEVDGTVLIQQFLPDPKTETQEFAISYEGSATVVDSQEMDSYQ
jgi:hypothetical protein